MTSSQDRAYLKYLKDRLEREYSFEDISYELTVRRSRRNDRFGVQDLTVNIDFSSKSENSELFKNALVIESAIIRAIHNITKNLGRKEASNTLAFPTILLPGLSHPAIRIGARYLLDSSLSVKRNKTYSYLGRL